MAYHSYMVDDPSFPVDVFFPLDGVGTFADLDEEATRGLMSAIRLWLEEQGCYHYKEKLYEPRTGIRYHFIEPNAAMLFKLAFGGSA